MIRSLILLAAGALTLAYCLVPSVSADDNISTQAGVFSSIAFTTLGPDSSIANVFGELGAIDPHVWRAFTRDPSTRAYVEAGSGFTSVSRGRGYWLITRDAATIHTTGSALSSTDTLDIPLARGLLGAPAWNQLGNPYPFPINVSDFEVLKGDISYALGATENTFTDRAAGVRVYQANPPGYPIAAEIQPNQAFWIRVADPDTTPRWLRWRLSATSSVGTRATVLALDKKGHAHLTFVRNDSLYHAVRVGHLWQLERIPSGLERLPAAPFAIAVDGAGNVHVGFIEDASSELFYATNASGSWVTTRVAPLGAPSYPIGRYRTASMAIDPNNDAKFAFWDQFATQVYYAYRVSGDWVIQPVATTTDPDIVASLSLAFDDQGVSHLVFRDGRDSPVIRRYLNYGKRISGVWSIENLELPEAFSQVGQLNVSTAGTPQTAYETADNELRYATKTTGGWATHPISTGTYGTVGPVIDMAGRAWVAMSNTTTGELLVARRDGGSWSIEPTGVLVPSYVAAGIAVSPIDGTPWVATNVPGNSLALLERSDSMVRLRVAPVAATLVTAAPQNDPLMTAGWSLAVRAASKFATSPTLYLGSSSDAARGWNQHSLARIPLPPAGDRLELYVHRENWGRNSDDYVRDVQPPASELSWPISLEGGPAAREVQLHFESGNLPPDATVHVEDRATGRTWQAEPGRSIAMLVDGGKRELTLIVRSGDQLAEARKPNSVLLRAFPNPFTSTIGFVFALAQATAIRADIHDLQGRLVCTLRRPASVAGEHALVWDGRDASGNHSPPACTRHP